MAREMVPKLLLPHLPIETEIAASWINLHPLYLEWTATVTLLLPSVQTALLMVMDGSRGLGSTMDEVFDDLALVQRWRCHKKRNI